ncbi:glycosyltransferase [Paenarthrobacter sp. NPDC089316]|uniref:glycosyltransferase n=1 Tax=unclassified Paenarthrobacter TaxID=2634190 RepID=UPI00342C2502
MDPIMYISGGRWDGLPGTDRLLAESLAVTGPVVWVDQPAPFLRFGDVRSHMVRSLRGVPEVLTPHLARLRVPAPPLFSSRVGRPLTEAIARHCMEQAVRASGRPPAAVVNASPVLGFPAVGAGVRLLHLTDDWLAAADLIGFPSDYLRNSLQRNIDAADVITAVSSGLASKMSRFSGRAVETLPNGCRPPSSPAPAELRMPVAALVGQLNERLDMDVLDSLADAGVDILVIGPRTDSNPVTGQRLEAFLGRENVDWRGPTTPANLAQLLRLASVGITPYADTEFNRSSFPLKTLEYLSAGLPVVATDLPSLRSLECSGLAIAGSAMEFVDLVQAALQSPPDSRQRAEMRRIAEANSWEVRAASLRDLCKQPTEGRDAHQLRSRRTT